MAGLVVCWLTETRSDETTFQFNELEDYVFLDDYQ
jgi:hypothetical protein